MTPHPHHLEIVQRIFVLCLVLIFPFLDVAAVRRLRQHTSSSARLAIFRSGVASLWILALLALALLSGSGRLPFALFTSAPSWAFSTRWPGMVLATLLSGYFALGLWPAISTAVDPSRRPKYFRALRRVRFMLPVNDLERLWFAALSLTAGICEEIVYRGFLLTWLHGDLRGGPHLHLTLAWLLSSLAFGTAHLYQKLPGVLTSTLAGLALGLAAILSGGLLLPILLHALLDLQMLVIYRPALDNAPEAALLISGCDPQT